ncbi:hypothetical protein SAMN02910456_01914 [Ruminococcaceae bacterium YRB3002]|nr:hypothetical protein SAMN02910456_01914 [Ruminococcaceae bacterium YRB3002]
MSKESLSSIRRRNGYSQEEVAHKMSAGRATVSRNATESASYTSSYGNQTNLSMEIENWK